MDNFLFIYIGLFLFCFFFFLLAVIPNSHLTFLELKRPNGRWDIAGCLSFVVEFVPPQIPLRVSSFQDNNSSVDVGALALERPRRQFL